MIIPIHITEQEAQTFFEGMGYECRAVEVPVYSKRTHGPDDVVMVNRLHVHVKGEDIQLERLMNEYVRMSILHPAKSAASNVDQAARNLTNRNRSQKPIAKIG